MFTVDSFFNVTLYNGYLKCDDNIKMEAYPINIIIILVKLYTQWKFSNNYILFVAFKKIKNLSLLFYNNRKAICSIRFFFFFCFF